MTRKLSMTLAMSLLACWLLAVPASAYSAGLVGRNDTLAMVATSRGGTATAFIKPDGSLWMWGRDGCMLGQGESAGRSNARPVKVMDNVRSVSGGEGYAAAIKTDGTLWMWGENYRSVLGDGTDKNSYRPKKIMDNVAAVSCGYTHTAAIKTDGSLWMWGENDDGELGNNLKANSSSTEENPAVAGIIGVAPSGERPVQTVPVKVMDNVRSVACGTSTTFAVTTDGTLWGWGFNGDSCLGLGGTGIRDKAIGNAKNPQGGAIQTVPAKIMDGVASVYAGSSTAAAIKTDGTLWMWGENWRGQLGNNLEGTFTRKSGGTAYIYQSTPVQIMSDVASVSLSPNHTCAIKKDGSLWAWGCAKLLGNNWVGNANTSSSGWKEGLVQTVPVKIMDNVAAVSVSSSENRAVKTDGTLWLWGHSASKTDWGMDTNDLFVPTQFPGAAAKLPGVSAAGSGQ